MNLRLPDGHFDSKGEYVVRICPSCRAINHLYWNVKKGTGVCFRCKLKLNRKLFKQYFGAGGRSVSAPIKENQPNTLRPILEETITVGDSAWNNWDAEIFLTERNITQDMCDQVPIKWDEEMGFMVIPVDSCSAEHEDSVLFRNPVPGGWPEKWFGPSISQSNYVFGGRHIRNDRDSVVVMEGMFDVVSTGLLGCAVAVLGSKISDAQAQWIAARFRQAVVWFDPDPGHLEGVKGARKSLRLLRSWGVVASMYRSPKDPKLYRWDSREVQEVLSRL